MADNSDITVVGSDSHFKGELNFERTARITGKFDGKIAGKGELHVSDNALCKADVNASRVSVDGTVEGNLKAKEVVRLNAKGVVRGDIVAGKMVMAEGASFFGQCAVGPEAQRQPGEPGSRSPGPGAAPGTRPLSPPGGEPMKK